MIDVFNTKFELSLRILLILDASSPNNLSTDKLVSIDFITIYGRDFGVSDYNLHGDNAYRFSEYTSRRDLIFRSIQSLVLQGYIKIICLKSGFYYSITDEAKQYCATFNNEYASEYSLIVAKSIRYAEDRSERELMKETNTFSIALLKGGIVRE